jgi:cell division protein FtsW (lipid II flippase)
MGVTYTHGRDRGRPESRGGRAALSLGEQLLLLTSVVLVLAVALAYNGRVRAEAWGKADQPAPVNLNAVTDSQALEAPLAHVFPSAIERKAAATTLAAHLRARGDGAHAGSGDALPNVGALSRIGRDERDEGAGTPLLTSAELAALKPYVSVRTLEDFRSAVGWCALALILSFHAVSLVWRWRAVQGDRILLALAHLLVGIGFLVMLSRPDPLRDTLLLVRYTEGVVLAVLIFGAVSMINVDRAAFRELTYLPLLGALALSVVLIIFGSGPGSSSAKVNLGPVQPIEAIRLLLALFLAGYFARRWELVRQVARVHHVLPVVVGVALALVLFFFQKDLGPALLLSLMFLTMFAVARGGAWLAGAGFAGLVAGFGVGYLLNISTTLVARLDMWRSPWDNAVRGGDQVAQALWGLAAGATTGTGAGLGHTRFVPEAHTDLVLAAIGEELGLIGLLVVGVAFALIGWRGLTIARRASSDYRFFLALALTLTLVIPAIVMAAGILGLLPLTGVVTPFLSYGGSAMVANFAALGLLVSMRRDQLPATATAAPAPAPAATALRTADLAPFRVPVRWLGRAGAVCAVLLFMMAATVQTLKADDYLVRPQLSVQADGGRRFHYNPRVLDALRAVPRGTIYDARGLPLASDDQAVLKKAAADYEKLGRRLSDACPTPSDRCYPAGPSFQHVLGDANTRANWSAGNSSLAERDAEDLLRGFDDRATTVTTTDRDGRPILAVRRDYSAVVPLVRHRYQPGHAGVKALLARTRDVRLTIDARLQLAVAKILEQSATRAGSGKGAVVVLDADTGDMLASVSYPWNGLDRARYGLYPPGSTFKMITAAAALRADPGLAEREFTCERLPSGRTGVRIPGFGPPIHDDDRDKNAHGSIALRNATVRSCNAYFAQLAVALGSDALAGTAAAAGITLNTSSSPERVRANLPHAGYGQGEVVTTPLRLARVAAALGSDGIIREAPIVRPAASATAGDGSARVIETVFVNPAAARMIAANLREAVRSGTGRLLRDHPARIGGKTGTAEVDEAASHAWFAGFAPHGQATRRIAFAVILENAGYGGVAAATVAGQVASAASAFGLVK